MLIIIVKLICLPSQLQGRLKAEFSEGAIRFTSWDYKKFYTQIECVKS